MHRCSFCFPDFGCLCMALGVVSSPVCGARSVVWTVPVRLPRSSLRKGWASSRETAKTLRVPAVPGARREVRVRVVATLRRIEGGGGPANVAETPVPPALRLSTRDFPLVRENHNFTKNDGVSNGPSGQDVSGLRQIVSVEPAKALISPIRKGAGCQPSSTAETRGLKVRLFSYNNEPNAGARYVRPHA